MSEGVYLDNHATTRVDPLVLEAMLPYFTERYGNASSRSHRFGWEAEEAVEKARGELSALLGCETKEVLFTSGATESNNLALKGVFHAYADKGRHLVISAIEHHAVLDTAQALARHGAELSVVPVGSGGRVDPAEVARALRPDTILVSVMMANNEIGTLQPIAEIARLCHERGVLLHTDAAQAAGRVPVAVPALEVDLLSLSGHKMYAPKGVGALVLRRRTPRLRLEPLFHGGGQERGLRPGTLAVPLLVGLGRAAALAQVELQTEGVRIGALRDRLLARLQAHIPDLRINGSLADRLPGNLNVSFPGVEGESLLVALKDIAVSSGAACSSGTAEPSHVLKAIGVSNELAISALRFGVGRFNTEAEVDFVAGRVEAAVKRLREMSPVRGT